ncbi:hypothetical protein [Pseudomonas sp. AB6]|uniref:hypothetical protein n=1 Tax=Pseudomonas sp. AB6 TaxID=3048598 RepID=UPI002AB3D9D5|nr:hypothetical protein [Pseudomonas sp. AB6]MDY7563458.1 hypothetical protein [Pseudomonas sp. AB6]MEB0213465.1 hypothetical protein [Pseudomonas sp. AB6]
MTSLSELDLTMEAASALADALDLNAKPCPTSRIRFITWILGRFEDAESLLKTAQGLPELPSELRLDYDAWVTQGCKTQSVDLDK